MAASDRTQYVMKINKEGHNIILLSACLSAAIWVAVILFLPKWLCIILSIATLAFLAFVISFFREPKRPCISDDSLVYAPADGKVVVIEEVEDKEYLEGKRLQVSVFMSITNVHINWYPVGGTVEYFKYHPGKFLVAWHPKSSEENERTTTVVNTGKHLILFRQIAGLVARRIVSYVTVGEPVVQNQKFGFIKFGSRIDLLLPPDSEILVGIGDKVTGSQTPLARLK